MTCDLEMLMCVSWCKRKIKLVSLPLLPPINCGFSSTSLFLTSHFLLSSPSTYKIKFKFHASPFTSTNSIHFLPTIQINRNLSSIAYASGNLFFYCIRNWLFFLVLDMQLAIIFFILHKKNHYFLCCICTWSFFFSFSQLHMHQIKYFLSY